MRIEPKVEAAPFLRLLPSGQFRWHEGVLYTEAIKQALVRARQTGKFTVWMADRLAVEILGVHPSAVWGDDWWLSTDGASENTGYASCSPQGTAPIVQP